MSEYKNEDFKGMLFPFHTVTENVLEAFPKLRQQPEFIAEIRDIDKIIKYIGFTYDKKSPLQTIENIIHRKVTAANLAGFENTDEEFVQDIMKCNNVAVNLMIVRYCRMLRSRVYMGIVAGNETLNDALLQLLNLKLKDTDKDILEKSRTRMQLLAQVNETAAEMDAISAEFLSDDNNELKDILYAISDMSEEEYLNLTPEDFSKTSWEEGHPKITSYGK